MQDWVFEVVHVRVFKTVRVWEDCWWRVLVSVLWVARFVSLSFRFFFFLCKFVCSIVWLSLLHQLWFWFSNLFHFFFFIHWILFKGFQHTTFGLLVCFVNFIFPRVIIASVNEMPISPLYLLPYEVFFLAKLKLPRRLVLYFWISCSICFVLSLSLSLSLTHTHTHTHTHVYFFGVNTSYGKPIG